MKKLLLLGAVFIFLGSASDVFAQRNRRGNERIRRGVESGRLTRDEARELRQDRREIRRDRRNYRSDGRLSRDERRELREDRREYRRELREELRDGDRRDRRYNQRRGNGYYRRGAGSPTHPVFGSRNRVRRNNRY